MAIGLIIFISTHAGADFSTRFPTVNAERENGSTPRVRVTWSTTAPPECVASVQVEIRTNSSTSVVRSYTTNTSETEVILIGFLCGTTYYFTVVVTGVSAIVGTVETTVQVIIEGKSHCMCNKFTYSYSILGIHDTPI